MLDEPEGGWPKPLEPAWLELWIAAHPVVAGLAIALAIGFAICVRRLGTPTLRERRPHLVFLVELVIVPMAIMVIGALLSDVVLTFRRFEVMEWLDRGRTLLLYASGLWFLARGLDLFFWQGWVKRRSGHDAPALVRSMTYVLLLLPVLALVLWWSGYSVTGVLLSTGVFAALVGLALQSTLSDLFSGIALSLEAPFDIGEWIELEDGTVGEVVDVTWRSTRLQSFSSSLLVVPNSKIAGQRLHNLSRPDWRYAAWYEVKLPPEIEPRLAVDLLREAASRCKAVLKRPPPVVRLADATTRPYVYMVWAHFPSYLGHFRGREELFREIDATLQHIGVRPAIPAYDVGIARTRPVQVEPPSIAHALRAVDLFASLDDQQIAQLAASSRHVTVEAGEVLMQEGKPVDAIHVLMSGVLEESLSPAGKRVVTDHLEPGASFGQISLVCSEPAIVSVTSASDAVLIRIEPEALRPLVEASPKLFDSFARIVSKRVETVRQAQLAATGRSRALGMSVAEIRQRIERLFGNGEGRVRAREMPGSGRQRAEPVRS